MEIIDPRQKIGPDGSPCGWHVVVTYGKTTLPVGYCAEHEPHPTAAEAAACYRRWCLDNARFQLRDERAQLRCAVCREWTDLRVQIATGFGEGGRIVPLCEHHQNLESLEDVAARGPGA